jgi:hypothetical protein
MPEQILAKVLIGKHPEAIDSLLSRPYLYLILPEGATSSRCRVLRYDLALPGTPAVVTIRECISVHIAKVCIQAEITLREKYKNTA